MVVWNVYTIETQLYRTADSISISLKNFWATASRASGGHGENQSIVVQLTIDGKSLILFRRDAPIGEKASTTCKAFLHLSWKNANSWAGVPSSHLPSSFAGPLTNSQMSAFSSAGKMFGTSPVLRILLTSSRKLSYLI